jgi:hypothetical protein
MKKGLEKIKDIIVANAAKQETNLIRGVILETDSTKGFERGRTKQAADIFK